MTQEDFANAYILLFSGAAELKGKAVKWKDECDENIYIEFPNLTPIYAITRKYYDNGNLWWESNWTNGLRHGKELWWYDSGKLRWERNWVKGLLHGKDLCWYENGKLNYECNWVKGLRYGKELSWNENGKLK